MGVHKLERRWNWLPNWMWGGSDSEVPITEATSDKGQSEVVTLPMDDAIQPVGNRILDIINTVGAPQGEAFVALVGNDVPKTASPLPEGTMEGNNIPIPAIPNIFPVDQEKKEIAVPQKPA
jgi:hypothetical protein